MTVRERASPFEDAVLYDLVCRELDYGIDFYVDLAKQAGGPVLDTACGTGRILLPCAQAGADIDGLDSSPQMLARLREKAGNLGLAPALHQSDMSSFQLPRHYALIMITFNAFCHNLTQEAQIACLECCRAHLEPGGMFVFDGFFPGPGIICAPQGNRELEGEPTDPETGLKVRCFDIRTFDRVNQIQHSINEVEFLDAEGNVTRLERSSHDARWVFKGEMELLLRVAGFSRWDVSGGFDLHPLTKETDGMVVRAWR